MNRKLIVMAMLLAAMGSQARERLSFDEGWLFSLVNSKPSDTRYITPAFDDSKWRSLSLPHDWAIEGDFSANNPSGAGGGALPGGLGWYRKHFRVSPTEKYDKYFVEFDGVYMNAYVYLNGHLLGNRPYGYSSFELDMTPYLNKEGDNVIAVRVDNSDQPNSRWYSGCGIYRHVWITKTAGLHVDHWGTYVTSRLTSGKANVDIVTTLVNETGQKNVKATVRNTILDAQGKVVAVQTSHATIKKAGDRQELSQTLGFTRPNLWTLDKPYLYTVQTEVIQDRKVVDTYTTTTGVRSFKFDAAQGFSLNGQPMKLRGVCEHHDFGCLGAAFNEDAMLRKLRILKDMGCNAIRSTHNPPAPQLLDMCDSLGFIVMDESFDMWRRRKTRNDYARYFDKWYERDLSDMVLRDRNHPSVLMWSIGNEVLEQWSSADADTLSLEQANLLLNMGHDPSTLATGNKLSVNSLLTQRLAEVVRRLDPARPITAGCNEPSPGNHLFKSGSLDIIGFNYHHQWVPDVPNQFPGKPFLFTESVSAIQTRGHYKMPSDSMYIAPVRWDVPYTDPTYQCSAYDNMHVSWGSTHEETWDVVKHTPYCSGEFIWTGFDYIGEPTPYGYPARSSYFGIIDLAGLPKDSYYFYQSEWTDKPVLHLFPHWNWIDGQQIDLWCYYNNADEVELFVNGRSAGVRCKQDAHQYHVMWRVTYHPGQVKVVARKGGKVVAEQTIRTAGAPDHLRFIPDKKVITADGRSLSFVTVEVVDKAGNLCPNADNQLYFSLSGPAVIAGVDNGNAISLERFKDNKRRAFYGKCVVVLQSTRQPGQVTLTAQGVDLKESSVTVTTK